MKRVLQCFLFSITTGIFCQAQQALSAAGGDAVGAGGMSGYTVGQAVYISVTGSAGTVSPGVQNPFEILDVTGLSPEKGKAGWEVYPNPVGDLLFLKYNQSSFDKLHYTLMDAGGKILEENSVVAIETAISMHRYPPATYFLKVTGNLKELYVFKIIKSIQP
jgi:hypothetical protein